MKRRDVIRGILSTPFVGLRAAEAQSSKPLILVLRGVTPGIEADRLFAVVDPIVSMGIPMGIAVEPDSSRALVPALKELFGAFDRDYPGLVELCVEANLSSGGGWFPTSRAASQAQTRFRSLAGTSAIPASLRPRLTFVSSSAADYSGLRAAGVRLVLNPPSATAPLRVEWLDNGSVILRGGITIAGNPSAEFITSAIATLPREDEAVVMYLHMSAFDGLDRQQVFNAAAKIATGLGSEAQLDRTRPILPSEFAVQNGAGFSRYLAILFEMAASGTPEYALQMELVTQLRSSGVRLTLATLSNATDADLLAKSVSGSASEICLTPPKVDTAALAVELARASQIASNAGVEAPCVVNTTSSFAMGRAAVEAGFATIIESTAEGKSQLGLDDEAMLHVQVLCEIDAEKRNSSAEDLRAAIVEGCGSFSDAVIAVRSGFLASPRAASALKGAFEALTGESANRLVTVGDIAHATIPADRALELLRKVRRGRTLGADGARKADQAERGRLLDDARLAWRYFERFSNKKTGFAPASAWASESEYSTYPFVTMWDCGSALLAVIAAHALELIGDDEFDRRASAMIASLHDGDEMSGGMRLPKAYMSVSGSGAGDSGYDASDMGRLLVALRAIESYTGGQIDCSSVVAAWDIPKTIISGRIHSYKNGRLVDIHDSAYANYTARGFSLWGFPVGPAFGIPVATGTAEELLLLIEALSRSEPVGAEPHVLEEVELGHSHMSRLVADLLFQAQVERFNTTGRYTCVSEGPLDREPWFTYQGYRILGEGNPWTIGTVVKNPRYETEGFKLANEVISTKSAFMWASVRPEAYSRDLLDYVRARGKIAMMGFTSGIFAATGKPMRNYGDINTNAEVLEAAAYTLFGDRPLHRLVRNRSGAN